MIILIARVVFSIIYFVYAILHRVMLFIYKKPPSIPPITDSLLTLSATTLARKIRQREITSYDVVLAYINRIQETKCINAVIDNRFKDAIVEAQICDEQLKAGKFDIETLEKEKPLYGIPFTVKESCAIKGCSYTAATLAYKGKKADQDATVVKLLRNAGAIPLCVTNIPEMCSGMNTTNLLYGRTCNPYDTRYSTGGSSGGEGALLGAGASLIGMGSDLGGSLRMPALFNGIFGHKPTNGIVPFAEHFPTCEDKVFQMLSTFGPMTRYAEDLNLMMRALTTKCDRNLRLDIPVDLKQLRVYYRLGMDKSLGILPVAPEIEECILKASKHFTEYGIHVDKLPIEWPTKIVEITIAGLMSVKKYPQMLVDINDHKLQKNAIVEMAKALLGLSKHTKQMIFLAMLIDLRLPMSESDITHYTKQGEAIRQKLVDLLRENGVLLYPTFHGATYFPNFGMFEVMGGPYCGIFNIFGCPALHVPMGLNREGLPIGIQVIAAPYQDRLCLAVAKELETAFGGWVPPSISIRH